MGRILSILPNRYSSYILALQKVEFLTLLHSEWPKLYGVLAILSAIGLISSGNGTPQLSS